jgi:hypothetical protein
MSPSSFAAAADCNLVFCFTFLLENDAYNCIATLVCHICTLFTFGKIYWI